MNLMVIGSGGREHALAWKLAQSDRVEKVYVAPGNAGTALEPGIENIGIEPTDFDALINFARSNAISLTVVGPEDPLVLGIVDRFTEAGLKCFGPSASAAQLEGSKSFTKDFLARHQIPTASYQVFEDADAAVTYISDILPPIVIKADGLAAGKGVVLAESHAEAEATIRDMLSGNVLGGAGSRIVIEEFLRGEEASFIVIADGEDYAAFATSQDHKAAFNGDQGPNTGGMGAYSPAPVVTDAVYERILAEVIEPTLRGMEADGHPYRGFLYAGLMIDQGQPKVIEFNCRFGDPETQPILYRLKSDLLEAVEAAMDGALVDHQLQFDDTVALTVVMASGGYPGSYEKGRAIDGLMEANSSGHAKVFHAGTALAGEEVVTSGGRVLGITATGATVSAAQAAAYAAVSLVTFEDAMYRTDIGYRAIARED